MEIHRITPRRTTDVLKNLKNPKQVFRRVQVGLRLGFEPTKQVYQHASKKNGASASGSGYEWENLKLVEKWVNFDVVSSTHVTSSETFAAKKVDDPINVDSDNEIDEVFNKTTGFIASTSFKVDNNSKSGSFIGNKSIYEQWKKTYIEDQHDDDDFGLTDAQLMFVNAFDISPRGQLRGSLTLKDVLSTLNSRGLKKRTDAKDDGDELFATGRSYHTGNEGRDCSRSK
nr:hypothetical protein [Tanacetum cinerariifolium]